MSTEDQAMAKKTPSGKKTLTKRVTKDQWLQCALEVLQAEGIEGVKIERLARQLGIARPGFTGILKIGTNY